jgi:hypothetical protein
MKKHPLIHAHPGSFAKLKYLQDLSVRIKTKVAEEVVDDVSLGVDGGAQLRSNSHILLQCVLDQSDPLHRLLCLVCLITATPLERVLPVWVACRGGGPCSVADPGRIVRVLGTTALLVLRVTTPIPNVPLGLLRGILWCNGGLLCCLQASTSTSAR